MTSDNLASAKQEKTAAAVIPTGTSSSGHPLSAEPSKPGLEAHTATQTASPSCPFLILFDALRAPLRWGQSTPGPLPFKTL